MNTEFLADLWSTIVDYVPENKRKDLAYNYVNLLTDFDVPASTIEGMMGIDSHLDNAIEYAMDQSEDSEFEDTGDYDENDDVWDDED
jgi:hypothetical protein